MKAKTTLLMLIFMALLLLSCTDETILEAETALAVVNTKTPTPTIEISPTPTLTMAELAEREAQAVMRNHILEKGYLDANQLESAEINISQGTYPEGNQAVTFAVVKIPGEGNLVLWNGGVDEAGNLHYGDYPDMPGTELSSSDDGRLLEAWLPKGVTLGQDEIDGTAKLMLVDEDSGQPIAGLFKLAKIVGVGEGGDDMILNLFLIDGDGVAHPDILLEQVKDENGNWVIQVEGNPEARFDVSSNSWVNLDSSIDVGGRESVDGVASEVNIGKAEAFSAYEEATGITIEEEKAIQAQEAESGTFDEKIVYGKGRMEGQTEDAPSRYLTLKTKVVGWSLQFFDDIGKMGVVMHSLHPEAENGELDSRIGYVNELGELVPLGYMTDKSGEPPNVFSSLGSTPMTFEQFLNNRIGKEVELNIAFWSNDGPDFSKCTDIMNLPCKYAEYGFDISLFDQIISADDGVYRYFSQPEVQQLIAGQGGDEFPQEVLAWFTGDITTDFDNIPKFISWAKSNGYISPDSDLVVQYMRAFE